MKNVRSCFCCRLAEACARCVLGGHGLAARTATSVPGGSGLVGVPTVLRMGLDIGSTTIKLVLLPERLPEAGRR